MSGLKKSVFYEKNLQGQLINKSNPRQRKQLEGPNNVPGGRSEEGSAPQQALCGSRKGMKHHDQNETEKRSPEIDMLDDGVNILSRKLMVK